MCIVSTIYVFLRLINTFKTRKKFNNSGKIKFWISTTVFIGDSKKTWWISIRFEYRMPKEFSVESKVNLFRKKRRKIVKFTLSKKFDARTLRFTQFLFRIQEKNSNGKNIFLWSNNWRIRMKSIYNTKSFILSIFPISLSFQKSFSSWIRKRGKLFVDEQRSFVPRLLIFDDHC